MPPESLPPGEHPYESLADACRRGAYRFAAARTASGRLHWLLGLSPEAFEALEKEARRHDVGLLLVGSRVSGPRSRQRTLHPALAALPLKTFRRLPSALFPGVEGVEIHKTAIKEYGPQDPRTSDLSVILVDPRRSPVEMGALARDLEAKLSSLGTTFPTRFYASLEGTCHRSEDDFLAGGEAYLRGLLGGSPPFSTADLRAAVRELYAPVNLPRPLLDAQDLGNALAAAALFSFSFSLGLGFHWILPVVGFVFGGLGRYLARGRAWIAFRLGDGVLGNALALGADAALGVTVMAGVIDPAAGLGLGLKTILFGSATHTLSKGTLRLFLDKRFSTGHQRRQALGVLTTTAANFLQGAVTSFVYAGSPPALVLQLGMAVLGLALVFGPPLRRLASPPRLLAETREPC